MIPMNDQLTRLRRSGIRAYTNLAKTVEDCVMLTLGEPDLDTPASVKTAAVTALEAGQTHYAPNQGLPALCKAVAEWETRRGFVCTEAQVLITAGATGALFTALMGILNPGDEVIVPVPAFPLYESIITMAGAKLVPLETRKDSFQITAASLAAVLTAKTRAIILNSPNNPTGTVYSRESLNTVKAAVLGKPIAVICDNVYSQLCGEACPDLSLDADLRDQMILCQSFSKPYAMTGWRVGYLVAEQKMVERFVLLGAAQVASIPTFLQTACIEALRVDTRPMAALYEKRRAYVCGRLGKMGLSYPEPEGAFYVFADIARFGMTSDVFCTRLIRKMGVAAVPGSCFGCEGYIRLSCACADEALERGMDRLEAFLNRLGENQ